MARLSMSAEAEKHMDGEIQSFVELCECEIQDITIVDGFF
jgi:hypothetical protein